MSQSGFLIPESADLKKTAPSTVNSFTQSISLGKAVRESLNPYFYHSGIDEIFKSFQADHRVLQDFAWREKLFSTVKKALNRLNILDLMGYQKDSIFFTGMHRKYILETMSYLNGDARLISTSSWQMLIKQRDMTDDDKKIEFDRPFNEKKRFTNEVLGVRSNTEIISHWVSCENGLLDFIQFFSILFAEQPRFMVR